MDRLLEGIINLPPALVLILAFICPLLEASIFLGIVFPGEIAIVLAGVLANQHKLPLWAAIVASVLGAIIGDSVGYWVGERWGERILRKIPDRLVDDAKMGKAQDAIRRYGGRAVFIGRFTAALRALVPGAAGMSRVPYRKFLLWNVLGGSIWATAFVLIGYLAGSQYQRIVSYANWIGIGLVVLIVVIVLVRYLRKRRQRSAPAVAADHS